MTLWMVFYNGACVCLLPVSHETNSIALCVSNMLLSYKTHVVDITQCHYILVAMATRYMLFIRYASPNNPNP